MVGNQFQPMIVDLDHRWDDTWMVHKIDKDENGENDIVTVNEVQVEHEDTCGEEIYFENVEIVWETDNVEEVEEYCDQIEIIWTSGYNHCDFFGIWNIVVFFMMCLLYVPSFLCRSLSYGLRILESMTISVICMVFPYNVSRSFEEGMEINNLKRNDYRDALLRGISHEKRQILLKRFLCSRDRKVISIQHTWIYTNNDLLSENRKETLSTKNQSQDEKVMISSVREEIDTDVVENEGRWIRVGIVQEIEK